MAQSMIRIPSRKGLSSSRAGKHGSRCKTYFVTLRASYLHMGPETGLARLPGWILLSVHMAVHKLVSFAAVPALWTLVTLLIKLIHILRKRKYIQDKKSCHFFRYVVKAKLFVLVTGAELFIRETFHSGYRDFCRKNRALALKASYVFSFDARSRSRMCSTSL